MAVSVNFSGVTLGVADPILSPRQSRRDPIRSSLGHDPHPERSTFQHQKSEQPRATTRAGQSFESAQPESRAHEGRTPQEVRT